MANPRITLLLISVLSLVPLVIANEAANHVEINKEIDTSRLRALSSEQAAVETRDARQNLEQVSETIGNWPAEFLARPISLISGVGLIRDPVSTTSAEAQAFYNHGLAFHYLYTYHDAARSFNQALRHDPEMAAAYLGLSFAYQRIGARDEARAAIEEAQRLSSRATSFERLRIQLRHEALHATTDDAREAYRDALEAAAEQHRDNVELQMLLALNSQGDSRRARLYAVLELAPDHVGAIHELIHYYETTAKWERAVKMGERLNHYSYSVPHAVHMYGHNLPRVGRVPGALRQFEKADSLERVYIAEAGIPLHHFGHFRHNLHYLANTLWHQGRLDEAEAALREGIDASTRSEAASPRPGLLHSVLAELLLYRGREGEALDIARTLASSPMPMIERRGHLLEAQALLALGQLDEAKRSLATARQLLNDAGSASREDVAGRTLLRSEAELALRRGERIPATKRLLALIEDGFESRSHAGWLTRILELRAIAQIGREVEEWDLVHRAASELVSVDPTYGRGHYLLGVAARHLGNREEASNAMATAERIWTSARPVSQ